MKFDPGTIFFGTSYENIYLLDSVPIDKPFHREELYISVSSSGYKGFISTNEHEDLQLLGKVYADKLRAAQIDSGGFLNWKCGYKNSITYLDGFGACDLKYFNCFGESQINNRIGKNITAVIHKEHQKTFILPQSKSNDGQISNEYLSLALHPFLPQIRPEMILGWIVDSKNHLKLKNDIHTGKIKDKPFWLVKEIDN